ncbi:hypothetical protein GCM10010112_03820 [Actinoplanes lobatus]|uniref:PKD domain-containing protein n=1 Tax=Actinoplanes lobatus TaxID=113568 RepID=A0A7W7HAF8_9ACTN|nr:hypothetical protein [Actinoplanes lobatus]MBB4746802.1 hypothetical protein [Actinoplanes lobatus]GGN54234.1 hypothetical protein GCM10010112_03820 [Actinoplanes lobatus]GIE38868.1 hypothetical protein Alo02nite_17660 [Actinoplanes lobatus]
MKKKLGRLAVTAGVTVAVIAPLAGVALAVVVEPSTPRTGRLTQAGPLAEHGFPAWYRDSEGVRLEACTTLDDPLCSTLPDEVPDPDLPISYPDNFPGEFFYQLAGAELTLANGVDATIGMDLEGAWAAEQVRDGDQMVFGRIRIRFDAAEGERYRITHPYGVDDLTATDRGIRMTEDIGTTAGAFGQALTSRIGPFLKWDPAEAPAAPAGYVGDPGVDHEVVGSPYGTNFIRIERFEPTSGGWTQVGFTDQFSVQGRYAQNGGVDIDQATYTVGADGKGVIEVYASSEPGQAVEVTGNETLGFRTTRLRGANGRYYGRFPVTGSVPAGTKIEVVNAGDRPVARKSRTLVDVVRVTEARYDADAATLTVAATSSDADATPPTFAVTGFGDVGATPFTDVVAPPATITVTSSSGGSTTVPVSGTGDAFLPELPVASAIATLGAVAGQRVVLDGSGSTGAIDTYAWTQTGGPAVALTDAATKVASFDPAQAGTYTFQLLVAGPSGAGAPITLSVTVAGAAPAVANAGADQTVIRGRTVTLDGTGSTGTSTYAWRQVSGPTVLLNGLNSAKPTFTYPTQALPAAPGPNTGYVYNNEPVVLELTVTGAAGPHSDQVTIRPQGETFTGLSVRYRTGNNEWRISGTSGIVAGQRITAVLGDVLTGRVIGTGTVDAAGAFSIRVTGPNPGNTIRTISLVSSTGGRLLATPVNVTN